MANRELFSLIHKQITHDPTSHHQKDWERTGYYWQLEYDQNKRQLERSVELYGRTDTSDLWWADEVRRHEQHFQGKECNTTRCVAGWAMVLASGEENVEAARVALGFTQGDSFERMGAKLLDIDMEEAEELFHNMNNSEAVETVRQYADGERE